LLRDLARRAWRLLGRQLGIGVGVRTATRTTVRIFDRALAIGTLGITNGLGRRRLGALGALGGDHQQFHERSYCNFAPCLIQAPSSARSMSVISVLLTSGIVRWRTARSRMRSAMSWICSGVSNLTLFGAT